MPTTTSDPDETPLVDVVILSWDRANDTIEAIRSALDQKGVRQTVIVIDQGSKEDELRRLRQFCQGFTNVKLLTNSRNTGVPAGRNQAARTGSSEYIVSLDNDAIFGDERHVATAVQLLREDQQLAGLAFRIKIYADGNDDRTSWPYQHDITQWAARSFPVAQVVGAGHVLCRSAFERVGGYDPTLFFMHEELDLGLRLMNAGYTLRYTPLVWVRHKLSPERRFDYDRERFYFHTRNLLYIACKSLPAPRVLLRAFRLLIDAFRLGRTSIAVRAIGGAIILLPGALRQRWFQPGVRLSRHTRRRIRQLGPTGGMNLAQRLRWYLHRALGTKAKNSAVYGKGRIRSHLR